VKICPVLLVSTLCFHRAAAQRIGGSLAAGPSHLRSGFATRFNVTTRDSGSTSIGLEAGFSGKGLLMVVLRRAGSALPDAAGTHEEILYESLLIEHRLDQRWPIDIDGSVGRFQLVNHSGTRRTCNTEAPFACVGPDPLVMSWAQATGCSIGVRVYGVGRFQLSIREHWVVTPPSRRFTLVDVGVGV
jgi:hypothetical protein